MGLLIRRMVLLLLLAFSPSGFTQTLLVLGDSISAGYGLDVQKGWVNLLQKSLGTQHRLINASISGNTSADGLARLPLLLQQHSPDIVIVELGGNDGLRGYPVLGMQKNLSKIIQASQQAGAKVLLMGMQIPPNYGKRYTEQFENSFPALAKQHNILLLNKFLESVALKPGYLQEDGIHPSEIAQAELRDKVLQAVKPLL